MSGLKGVMKEGWHPKGKDGKKESWRNDFKGINQVAGWMGKGKDNTNDREEHVSAPLSSLKDPASFGPPPKHIKYHGAAALPNETTPDRRGLGAPLPQEQIDRQNAQMQEQQQQMQMQEEAAQKPAPPPLPYRANRTGLDTSNLPPPPVRRMGSPADSIPPPSSRPKPNLPPRLPSRNNSTPSPHPPTPPPAYSPHSQTPSHAEEYINQGAASRLSQAGVSVPALGIGNNAGQWGRDSSSPGTASPAIAGSVGQAPVNELQSRFSQLRTTSSSSPAPPPPPARTYTNGSTAQSVSSPEPRTGSSTVSEFRERHNDKIQAGKQKLNGLNEKYGISQRVNKFFDDQKTPSTQAPPVPPHPNANSSTSSVDTDALSKRKAPPPPPPPKKAGMRSTPVAGSAPTPPPLPLNTKPR
ncbi:hypothetical protein AtubIFM55763_007114 [Aspergillus tubingensis]|uniref:Glyceraldehyde 3-phosphate dehydrogenase n=2 Tax=Aspergillus subgen. Circumdati TaxID=2720871 RepID=A0A100I488_ASPNG|nr:hypothetical protein An01g10310 [Aspergillus niger]GLA64324.1 hypothetical protein AtubIFM54640_006040 [Aspergillus tubingensis]GLA68912.1 hypothetical protein AtubIFM55763_007114 [Aspergillus tubingensis]GLA85576.1 hypothetical protein AtubIFM56815_009815 [Aspergillus tubingensis]GLA91050.1 hypothetical protein AtubIFM57143_003068 [Aspergillus tubingensis]